MTEARTTTTIPKPPGRRASDARRSRLGDYTRPIAKERRITPNRKPAILFTLIAIVVAGAIGAALFGLPVRTWFGQDRELAQLDRQLAELQGVNAELQDEVNRLQTDDGLREAAREELGLIQLGETRQTVVALPDLSVELLPDGWPYTPIEQIMAIRAAGP